jgi:hypothetical protein
MKIDVSKRMRLEWELSWHVASHLSLPWELCLSLQPLLLVAVVAVAVAAVVPSLQRYGCWALAL